MLKNTEIIKKPLDPFILRNNQKDLKIQLLDFYRCLDTSNDAEEDENEDDDDNHQTYNNDDDDDDDDTDDLFSEQKQKELSYTKDLLIKGFAILPTGQTLTINFKHFKPFFYIKIPDNWTTSQRDLFIIHLKTLVYFKYKEHLLSTQIVIRKPFTEFTGNDRFKFLKLEFKNKNAFDDYARKLLNPIKIKGLNQGLSYKYDLFESNIEPILKFIHLTKIKPSGWALIPKQKYQISSDRTTRTHFEIDMEWNLIQPLECLDIAPINIAAFDIEADSSHGDFPMGIKAYQKLAQDLVTVYNEHGINHKRHKQHHLFAKHPQSVIENALQLVFNNNYNNNGIHQIITQNNLKPQPETIRQIAFAIEQLYQQLKLGEVSNEDFLEITQDLFENNLPPIDLQARQGSYYGLMAREIMVQLLTLTKKKNKRFQTHTNEIINLLIESAFMDYFDGFNINVIYTKHNLKPDPNTLTAIVPDILKILNDCANFVHFKRLPEPSEFKTLDGTIYNSENLSQDAFVIKLTELLNLYLPPVEGDPLIQIGTTCQIMGQPDCYLKHIICLNQTNEITNDEMVQAENQDIYLPIDDLASDLVNYENNLLNQHDMSSDDLVIAIANKVKEIKTWEISYRKLQCQKAAEYRRIKQSQTDHAQVIVECFDHEKDVLLAWKQLIHINDPDILIGYNIFGFDFKFLYERALELNCAEEFCQLGRLNGFIEPLFEQKLSSAGLGDNKLVYIPMTGRVIVDLYKVIQKDHQLGSYKLDSVCHKFLFKEKVDVSPQEIFVLQKGSEEDRKKIAVYCLIDCILCNRLISKLCIINNNMAMSNVCQVPFPYLFLRGQGVKLLSLVSEYCSRKGFLIPVLPKADPLSDDSYEGAIVLKPFTGIYFDPIAVADFNSLYPSSMISENISHDSFVKIGGKYDNLPGFTYVDIEYDDYKWTNLPGKKKRFKIKTGVTKCRYAQLPNNEKSIIPAILMELLAARKVAKKKMATETDPFRASIYEGQQLSYKVTANSLYGQTGAKVSPLYKKEIAASTTAVGRSMIMFSKKHIETQYKNIIIELTLDISGIYDEKTKCKFPTKYTGMKVLVKDSYCVYGDTDSIFCLFGLYNPITKEKYTGLDAVFISMAVCTLAAKEISDQLKKPQNLEMEKVIWPFILITKKRYHGHYYTEMCNDQCYAKSMGIALKRRDNAPIVKKIFGGTLDIIMKEHNLEKARNFAKEQCTKLLKGEFGIEDFIITKALKSYYKKPNQIAHNVLAQRQAQRDPGNKFQSNDRVPYAFIIPDAQKTKILQGDKIETIDYIKQNNKSLNYKMYLENQIINPVSQIFDLVPGFEHMEKILTDLAIDYDEQRKGATKIDTFIKKKTQITNYANLLDLIKQANLEKLHQQEVIDVDDDYDYDDNNDYNQYTNKNDDDDIVWDENEDHTTIETEETLFDNYEIINF